MSSVRVCGQAVAQGAATSAARGLFLSLRPLLGLLGVLASIGCSSGGNESSGAAAAGASPATSTEASPSVDSTDARRPDVLLITLDTLRQDRLPIYGYRGVRTPALSTLARHAVVFENGRSHAPITLPSHTSILTGLYPPQHGVRSNGGFTASPDLTTLAERLKAAGYRTGAFVSAFVLDSRFGLDQGFDHYDDDLEDGRPRWSKFGVKDRRGEMTVGRALSWIDAQPTDAPTFTWIHLYDPHFAYEAPEPFKSRFADPYDAEIAYTDAQVGRLLEGLRQRPGFDDTLIIVTADHGESLGEHGESTHSLFIYEATKHVPLLVRFPNGAHAGKRTPTLARHIDIVPTVLDVAGLDSDIAGADGRSLRLALEHPESAGPKESYAEAMLPKEQFGWASLHALERDGFKYIEAPRAELYATGVDRDELEDLYTAEPERVAAMSQALGELRAHFDATAVVAEEREMDEETRAQLAALGYINEDGAADDEAGLDPKDMIAFHEVREKLHRLMDAGDYAGAIVLADSLSKDDPDNPALIMDLAACHAELQQWDEALSYFKRGLELRPDNGSALVGIAKVRFKGLRQFEQAERDLAAAQILDPNDPTIHGVRGDLFHEMGRYAEAADSYALAVEAGDVTPSYLLGWASALNLTNRLGPARDAIERAIRLEPQNPIAHYNHGVILSRMQLPAAAEGALLESLRLAPSLSQARVALARLVADRGRALEAVRLLEFAVSSGQHEAALLLALGAIELEIGRTQSGVQHMEQAADAAPQDASIHLSAGHGLAQAGQFRAAETHFVTAGELFPTGSPARCGALLEIARSRARDARLDQARAGVRDALACGGDAMKRAIAEDRVLRRLVRNHPVSGPTSAPPQAQTIPFAHRPPSRS